MSFAPAKKSLSYRPPSNSSSSQKKSAPRPIQQRPADPLLQRLTLLEDVVANLQLQHDTFIPLLQLIGQVDNVLELESEAKTLVSAISDLESHCSEQQKLVKEINAQSQSIQIPTSLADGEGAGVRPLSEMQKTLTDIETHSNSIAAKQKVTLKKQEVSSREEMLRTMQELENEVQEVKKEVVELHGEFIKGNFKEIGNLEERASNARSRVKDDIGQVETALEDHALYGGKGGDNWLLEELNHRVDDSISELNEYLDYKHRQLEVFFKQELLSLKNQHEKLSSDLASIEAYRNVADPAKELTALNEKIKNLLQAIEKFSDNFVMMNDVTISLNQSLVDLNDKARRYIKTYRTTDQSKQNELFGTAKVDFDQWLKGSWYQVEALRENIENLDVNINSNFFKLTEFFQRQDKVKGDAEGPGKPRIEDLKPKANSTKSKFEEKQESLHIELDNLKKRLFGLWKAINKETNFNIVFPSKNASDQEIFRNARDDLISDSINS
ncbi:unnamed protein product [Blepharisma stoltei]|uniref:Autophagy-related protein 17 n=1 Tax=Blepharisma stoltei TaxID=1481888 RepID=A0AAU9JYX2_9CILI|nr:unnamed protein product [Blepharisma stoltei]